MTLLLALGWPVAGFCAWRWWCAASERDEWHQNATLWESVAEDWRQDTHRAMAQTDAAIKLGESWKDAALMLYATTFRPFGRSQSAPSVGMQ